jgi:ubiquinone/menaquinone biosynthesis C-methylase UbiE
MLTVDFREIQLKSGMRVLDAGCGSGRHLCEAFRTPGVEVAGFDLNPDNLLKTKGVLSLMDQQGEGRWLLARADVANIPFADGSFDVVVCSEVLEHIAENRNAVAELVRVLKNRGDLMVSVPRFWPESVCWALSEAYHREPGGHIRIYKKKEMMILLEEAGMHCRQIRYRHALHAPYWWLRCLVGHKNERFVLVKAYRRFLEWSIMRHSTLPALMEWMLNPLIGKSIVFYLKKGRR